MKSLLLFLGVCAGIVLIAWTVSKVTGSRIWYIEDWTFAAGETVLWRDDATDNYVITKYGQAKMMSFARLRRGFVVVTNQRIIMGARGLWGKKRIVQQVLYPGVPDNGRTAKLGGGLLTIGYTTIAIEPRTVERHLDGKKPHVDLTPVNGQPSSTNVQTIRIFTDSAATFRLPGNP